MIHAYVLLHLLLLSNKLRAFDKAASLGEKVGWLLPTNVFVLLRVGPSETQDGLLRTLLNVVRFVSLILGPLVLLMLFELQFLPYHNVWICWWLRIIVLADLAALWLLWPSAVSGGQK